MLDTILLAAILLLEAVEVAIMVAAGKKHAKRWAGAAEAETETEELRLRENRMDEGFENLMRFSVGGKDGLGGTGDE